PLDRSTNIDPATSVSWTSVAGAQAYYLYVGTSIGAKDVYESGETLLTTVWPSNLQPNETYYLRLLTKINNSWSYVDTTFTTGTGAATFTYPTDGQTDVNPFGSFTWGPPLGAHPNGYLLYVGTTLGARDVFESGLSPSTSAQPFGLLPNQTYYARVWTYANNRWHHSDATFQTRSQIQSQNTNMLIGQDLLSTVEQATASVRSMAGIDNVPVAGSLLAQNVTGMGRTQATCLNYALTLAQVLAQEGIPARIRFVTLTGTGTESHTTTEYFDAVHGVWSVADATFGVIYFDPTSQTGQSVEQISSYVASGNYGAIQPLFVTSSGDSYMRGYYLDPVTVYLNYYPAGGTGIDPTNGSPTLPTQNSPLAFLNEEDLAGVQGTAGVYLFHFANFTDSIDIQTANGVIHLTPSNNTLWSVGIALPGSWRTSEASGLQVYQFKRVLF
ncbi:MAG: hypothetical protein JOZ62_13480, partial [Acidobacteriaceae bacterium]|nr:hypothetical protein [Acidobacteriaceae bacterium]